MMSDTGTNPQPPDQDFQQLLAQAAGQSQENAPPFGEDFPYAPRTITGVKKGLEQIVFPDVKRTGSADRPMRYTGHMLVDGNGVVIRNPYNPSKESRTELTRIAGTAAGANLLNLLASRGFYGKSTPSAGALQGTRFEAKDLQAMEDLLYYSNSRGYTWEPLVQELMVMPSTARTGGGVSVRVTSAEDLGVYLRDEAFRQLGRNLTKNELQQAIQNIQNQQRERAMSSQDAPSPAVAARQQVGEAAPARAAAMRLGAAMSAMFGGG
jgi:hypothetical protein